MKEPSVLLYVVGVSSSGYVFRVPCFNHSEAALVEFYFLKNSCANEIFFESRKTGDCTPEILKEAAEFVYGKRPKMHFSRCAGKPRTYLITATARRLLIPREHKIMKELLKERLRKEA